MQEVAKQVLVVEDDVNDQELLRLHFVSHGVESHVAFVADGADALEFLKGPQALDLRAVVLDLRLPLVDGLEVLAALRADERTRQLPVIVMTCSTTARDIERCRVLGAACYVEKPISFDTFTRSLEEIGWTWPGEQATEPLHREMAGSS